MKISTLFLVAALTGCAAAPREETVVVPGTKIRLELVYIPGSGKAKPFWISRREVTWGDFDRFYQFPDEERVDGVTRPSSGKNYLGLSGLPAEFMEDDRPVTNLRYHSALVYCEWLSRKTGMSFRLPTETEWEAACGTDEGWTQENSGGRTHRGGERQPEARGPVDLMGNVWEYCLEPDRPPDFGPVLRGGAWNAPAGSRRRTIPAAWEEVDPNRPFSTWWLRGDHSQGLRLVRVADGTDAGARAAYARKITISNLRGEERTAKVGGSVSLFSRVTGEVLNGGDRALDELILKVYFLDPSGKPHVEDVTSTLTRRATFNLCTPVLASSAHPGDHARPLRPGERRGFVVDLPMTMDADADVQIDRFGASVLQLRFASE